MYYVLLWFIRNPKKQGVKERWYNDMWAYSCNSSRVAVNYSGETDNNYPDLIKEVLETIIVDGGMSINMQ